VTVAIVKSVRACAVANVVARAPGHVARRTHDVAAGAVIRIVRDLGFATVLEGAIAIGQARIAQARAQHTLAVELLGTVEADAREAGATLVASRRDRAITRRVPRSATALLTG